MSRRFRFGWNVWLFVVVWAGSAVLVFPSIVHRLANRDGFWDGGFVQGTGILFVTLRLAQSALEAVVLAAVLVLLGYVVLLLLMDVLSGETKPSDLLPIPPKRSLEEWIILACFVVLSAAVFPLVTHWILWSDYAVVRKVGVALLSIAGPTWLLALLWLVYKPVGESDVGKQHSQALRFLPLSRFRRTSRLGGRSR